MKKRYNDEQGGEEVSEGVPEQLEEAPAMEARGPATEPPAAPEAPVVCAHAAPATEKTEAVSCRTEAVQGDKVCARHQSRTADHWARKHGMADPLLEQATFRGKGDAQGLVRARAIPGRLNPKFDAFNQARAHHGWGPTHEMTEEEFLAGMAAPKAHVFR